MKKNEMEFVALKDGEIRDILKSNLSRKFYRSLTNRNLMIYLNGNSVKNYELCKENDKITIVFDLNDPSEWPPVDEELKIYYEDINYMIVYKKSELLSIPKASEPRSLYQMIYQYLSSKNKLDTIHLINRLDKDTDGLVLIAKNRYAAFLISEKRDNIQRNYYALCDGKLPSEKGIIDLPIAKEKEGIKRIIAPDGKNSVTEYEVIKYENDRSIVRLKLRTGRTHQIRVHLMSLGNPIIGDKLYGKTISKFMHLTCYSLKFINPFSNEEVSYEIEPEWMCSNE